MERSGSVGFYANSPQPLPDALGRELAPVGTADVLRNTPVNEQVAQPFENIFAREPSGDIDRQALPSELVHDRHHPDGPAIGCVVGYEVVAQHMISMGGP